MAQPDSACELSTRQLILIPALITLAVTVIRLAGELWHGPTAFFGGDGSIVGITWLAPVFGIYFAIRLALNHQGPRAVLLSLGCAALGAALILALNPLQRALFRNSTPTFQTRLLVAWGVFALAGLVTVPGWPRLWKTLLAYGYAARVPVVIIMLFAFRGHWGTHYDAMPSDFTGAGLISTWLWLGFFPQFVFWIGFTLACGMLFGTITGAVLRLVRRGGGPT